MTVGEMRRIMLGKIVPESVVPQNMVNLLIDENAELPEPDAFTFLNRLRGLGIGSADFVYLLEGCGAPKAAVDKIKANPAMNLQGLILTLESSGMTAKDYTRILYTARQIWERTLTLRLETSERISEGEYPDENAAEEEYAEYEEPSFEKVMDITMTDLNVKEAMASDNGAADGKSSAGAAYAANISATGSIAKVGNSSVSADEPASESVTGEGSDFAEVSDATEELMSVDFDSFDATKTLSLDATVDPGRINAESQAAEGILEAEEAKPEVREEIGITGAENASEDSASEPFEVHIASYDEPFGEAYDEPYREPVQSGFTESFDALDSADGAYDTGGFGGDHADAVEDKTVSFDRTGGASDDSDEIVAASPEDFHEKKHASFKININYDDEDSAPDVRSEEPRAQQYNGQTTMIVPIDQDAVRENIARLADDTDGSEESGYDERGRRSGRGGAEAPRTAKQVSKKRDLDDNDRDNDDHYEERRKKKVKGGFKIHKGAIVAAAVGVAALIAVNIALSVYLSTHKEKKIEYASDASAIFTDIYYAHNDNISGGDTVFEFQTDHSDVFGDLLLCGTGLGAFTAGNGIYSVSENKITTAVFEDGELRTLGHFEPADGTHFVAAFEADGALIAMYTGNECGYLKIKGDQTLYTVRQSGVLTDFKFENGEIKIGSVYTPRFYETFNAEKTEVYLPKVGVGADMKPIDPANVILSNTKGYSYAMSASYNVSNGIASSAKAAMGDPVYASADGCFMMNGSETSKRDGVTEYGLLINAASAVPDSNEALTKKIGKIGCAATFAGGSAAYEDGMIVVRDREFNVCGALGKLTRKPAKLRFSGNVLIASDENGAFLAADCSNTAAPPVVLRLTQASGSCSGEAAVTLERLANGVKITRYMLENGAAKEISTFTRELPDEQARTLVCGTANAMITRRDCCGAAYSYFDGVSVISEYVTLSDASETATLFDDKTGFEYAFAIGDKVYAVCSKGAIDVTRNPESEESAEQPGGN